MSTSTARPTQHRIECPSWCVRDIVEAVDGATWHHSAPVTVQMSRDEGGLRGGPPAVLELELSFLERTEPLLPDYSTPEVRVEGNDGSGSLVQLCLSVEDVEAVAGEMLRLARAAMNRNDREATS